MRSLLERREGAPLLAPPCHQVVESAGELVHRLARDRLAADRTQRDEHPNEVLAQQNAREAEPAVLSRVVESNHRRVQLGREGKPPRRRQRQLARPPRLRRHRVVEHLDVWPQRTRAELDTSHKPRGEPVLVLLPRDLPRAPLAHPLPRRADTRVLVLQRRAPL